MLCPYQAQQQLREQIELWVWPQVLEVLLAQTKLYLCLSQLPWQPRK